MKRILGSLVALLAACLSADAQTARAQTSGAWVVEAKQEPWVVFFSESGSRLSGTVSSCGSDPADGLLPAEIYDGNVTGNTVQFKCQSLDRHRTITFKGVINGDDMLVTYEQQVLNGTSPGDLSADANGMFGASTPPRFTAKRIQDGGAEFAAAVNLVEKGVKVEGNLFVPQKISHVRSVVVLVNPGTWGGLASSLYANPEMRTLSTATQSTLLVLRISSIGLGARVRFVSNAGGGSADGLLQLLNRLAVESKHPELTEAPLLLWGHSAGGSFATTFAALHPERTIAFVRYHCAGLPGVDVNVLSTLPALLLEAGKDQIYSTGTYGTGEGLWKNGRSLGGPWTFGIEPDATHQDAADLKKANTVLIPWMMAVIRQRVSPDGLLRVVPDGSGYLGNTRTAEFASYATFAGPKRESSWLPDEATARGWQAVVRPRSTP
jgi:pimeloyl-ACP methyl ester carboxylesterase